MGQTEIKQYGVRQQAIRLLAFFGVFLLVSTLSACFGGTSGTPAPVLGHVQLLALDTTANVTCSTECAETAQCGDTAERGKVVLLSTAGPKTENHDVALNDNSPVTVVFSQEEIMRRMSTNDTPPLKFYQVIIEGRENPAWVAGFCIQGTPAQ
jgi:hypothetical protein